MNEDSSLSSRYCRYDVECAFFGGPNEYTDAIDDVVKSDENSILETMVIDYMCNRVQQAVFKIGDTIVPSELR